MIRQIIYLSTFLLLSIKTYAQAGAALNFDGINDYCDPNILVNNVFNNFTIEMWARPADVHEIDVETNSPTSINGLSGQNYAIWPTWRGSSAGVGISVGTNGVSVYEHGANYLTSILTWSGTLNGWTHIALVVNNKLSNLYINGQFVKAGLVTTKSTLYPSLGECGQYGTNVGGIGGGSYGYYVGDLDEVRYWSTVRTQQQIADNMNSELQCTTGMFAYYKFNHGIAGANNSGSTVMSDFSGNNYSATLTNFSLSGLFSNWIAPGAVPILTNVAINVSPSNTTICQGNSLKLTLSGSTTYSSSVGTVTASTISVLPNVATTYTFASSLAGCIVTTTCVVQVSKCTDIADNKKESALYGYPNPVIDNFTLQGFESYQGVLYDQTGRELKRFIPEATKTKIDFSDLSKGVYLLRLSNEESVKNIRIVKE